MEIKTQKHEKFTLIKLHGRFSLGAATDSFRDTILGLIDRGEKNLLLDLHDVPLLDSSGIGALVRCHNAVQQAGGKCKLFAPSDFVRRSLELVRVDSLFEIYEDEKKAAASFLF